MSSTQSVDQPSFAVDRRDAAECSRLRLFAGLTPDAMAELAGLPGRWAWLSIENGYEPIHPGCWVLCLMKLRLYPEF